MAQLKVYSYHPYHVHDKRIKNILTVPRSQTRYEVYVSAYSKADATRFAKEAQCGTASSTELRVASGIQYEALREATLFDDEGIVLVTSEYGGKRPVVLADGENGAQTIGVIKPAEGRAGYVFEATTTRYAGRGSVAVGAEVAFIKNDVGFGLLWHGTNHERCDDGMIQHRIDMGELTMIRSGFGDWFHTGR